MKIVIDMNAFISALYLPDSKPGEAVYLARRRRIRNYISPSIVAEIERILAAKLLWSDSEVKKAITRIEKFSF